MEGKQTENYIHPQSLSGQNIPERLSPFYLAAERKALEDTSWQDWYKTLRQNEFLTRRATRGSLYDPNDPSLGDPAQSPVFQRDLTEALKIFLKSNL